MRRAGKQAARVCHQSPFHAPFRDFALIARKLTGVFNFIAVLEAEFNAHEMVNPISAAGGEGDAWPG